MCSGRGAGLGAGVWSLSVFSSLGISRTVANELNEENTMAVLGAASAAAGGTWSVYLWLREVES